MDLLVPRDLLGRPDHRVLQVHLDHPVFLAHLVFQDAWLWVHRALLALQDPRALLVYLAFLL